MASKSPEMLEVLGLDCEWVSEPGNRGGRGRGEEQRESRRGNIIRREGGEKGRGGGIGRGEREGEGEGGEGQRRRERGGEGMHPVALLQLAFLDDHCVLVRLCKTGALPPSLSTLLQDNKYIILCDNCRLTCSANSLPVFAIDVQRLNVQFAYKRGCTGTPSFIPGSIYLYRFSTLDKNFQYRRGVSLSSTQTCSDLFR